MGDPTTSGLEGWHFADTGKIAEEDVCHGSGKRWLNGAKVVAQERFGGV